MFKLKIYDKINDRIFDKMFNSPYLLNKFKSKVKYSKKLEVIGEENL